MVRAAILRIARPRARRAVWRHDGRARAPARRKWSATTCPLAPSLIRRRPSISASTSSPIALGPMADPVPADLTVALSMSGHLGVFSRVTYWAETGSTNDLALSMATRGEPEGVVVIADQQHAGRGRRGRDWFSPSGAGVYLSAIVRPQGAAGSVPILTLAAGVAAAQAVRSVTALPVGLKWPNDLVIGRPWRKLGGVLCETAGHGGRIDAVVVGIGINLLETRVPTGDRRPCHVDRRRARAAGRTCAVHRGDSRIVGVGRRPLSRGPTERYLS